MSRPTLADILRSHGAAYRQTRALSREQGRAWRAIVACRTAALGGTRERCSHCGFERAVYCSCGNRHCPQCQTRAKERWRLARLRELLPVPYAHWVFTLPHALNPLAAIHPVPVFEALFASVAATLATLANNPRWLGAMPAVTLVLHTWTQDLRRHLHVHALVTCGGLDDSGHWRSPVRGPGFLFPVKAASKVFRAHLLDALDAQRARGQLPHDPEGAPAPWQRRRRALLAHDWVVYAKPPPGGPAQVLDYLARYTHRTALSNERLLGDEDGAIHLRVRDRQRGTRHTLVLDAQTFIGRFLQHVLPKGFKRIRHFGLLAPAQKRTRLSRARAALNAPEPRAETIETAQAFLARVAGTDPCCCPHCRIGRWICVGRIAPIRMQVTRCRPVTPPAPEPRSRDGPS